jgi:nucleotidyltransferase/DNA polymerase involved in DNA repair
MDAFFASIEQRDNPAYRSKPVIVGADPKSGRGRGVVSTCSYEARKFGIHSAMPISAAYKKCPNAIFLPPDMAKYEMASSLVFKILYSFTPDVEPVGIDEAFLDITGSFHLFGASTSLGADGEPCRTIGTPLETCRLIKSKIKDGTGLTASVGLAPNKMAAKIASDLKKPDGLVEVVPEKLLDFLWPLEIRRIWGLGPKSEEALAAMGIATIGELAKTPLGGLVNLLGKNGEYFRNLANGIDERDVEPDMDVKSVSNEITFDQDTDRRDRVEGALIGLCEKVSGRLRRNALRARTITLKIRLKGFYTYTRSITLDEPTNLTDSLYKAVKDLYNKFGSKENFVRLIGVRASNLLSSKFGGDLFPDRNNEKLDAIDGAVSKLKMKFGEEMIFRAGSRLQ